VSLRGIEKRRIVDDDDEEEDGQKFISRLDDLAEEPQTGISAAKPEPKPMPLPLPTFFSLTKLQEA
jgi:hypothetical protein